MQRRVGVAVAMLCAYQGLGLSAHATVVERVVAVVGEHAVLLSEMRQRARPMLYQIHQKVPPGPQRSAVESEMYKSLLEQMVDERLEQMAAERTKPPMSITSEQVDGAVHEVAARAKLPIEDLYAEVVRSGITVQEYRDQIRRQLLEQLLMSVRVNPRIRLSSEDIRVGYVKLQREERRHLGYRLQWIVLHMAPDSSSEARQERRQLADQLVALARGGVDFADLVARYSDDSATRGKAGDLGPAKTGELAPVLEEASLGLDVGAISNPLMFGTDWVILRLAERDASALPPLAEAQEEVAARVYGERREKARRQWLDELKKGVYVDVRL